MRLSFNSFHFKVAKAVFGVLFTVFSLPGILADANVWRGWLSENPLTGQIFQVPPVVYWSLVVIGVLLLISIIPFRWRKVLELSVAPSPKQHSVQGSAAILSGNSKFKIKNLTARNFNNGIVSERSQFDIDRADLEGK